MIMSDLINMTLCRNFDLLNPREEIKPRLHRCIVELVQLNPEDNQCNAIKNRLAMKQIHVPYPQTEFYSFQTLNIVEHCHHPAMKEEFILNVYSFELFVKLRQDSLEELVEEIHSPFDLG